MEGTPSSGAARGAGRTTKRWAPRADAGFAEKRRASAELRKVHTPFPNVGDAEYAVEPGLIRCENTRVPREQHVGGIERCDAGVGGVAGAGELAPIADREIATFKIAGDLVERCPLAVVVRDVLTGDDEQPRLP